MIRLAFGQVVLGEFMVLQSYEELSFDEVFTYEHLYKSYLNCCKGVNWKTSTKNYQIRAVQNVADTYNKLKNGTYKSKPFAKFTVTERGKAREIRANHISDRIVQKCYCDFFLVPLLTRRLIYDNGACMKGKGLSFTAKRLKAHLQKYRRKYGTNIGYILTFDYSKFFDSIDHKLLLQKVRKVVKDDRLYNIYAYFVSCFEGDKGIGLGSQISQVSALFYTNEIDHYIKERLHIKFYARYMDDGYLISNSKEELIKCRDEILRLSEKLKLRVNLKKTRIWRIDKGFMFLNRHWKLMPTGYIKLKPSHTTLLRLRKRYRKLVKTKDIDAVERYASSTSGFLKFFNNNRRLRYYVYNKNDA